MTFTFLEYPLRVRCVGWMTFAALPAFLLICLPVFFCLCARCLVWIIFLFLKHVSLPPLLSLMPWQGDFASLVIGVYVFFTSLSPCMHSFFVPRLLPVWGLRWRNLFSVSFWCPFFNFSLGPCRCASWSSKTFRSPRCHAHALVVCVICVHFHADTSGHHVVGIRANPCAPNVWDFMVNIGRNWYRWI